MQKVFWENYASFYFIGIGGTSMSSLAKFMLAAAKRVGGSDIQSNVYTDELYSRGVEAEIGDKKGSVADYDVIVYTDAVKENDIQLEEARALGKTILSRGQLLYEISRAFKKVIAVSGCHGKTTCAAMLAHIFHTANKKFCAHIGGRDVKFSNFYISGFDFFITEACEYKKNFLLLKPDVAVVLNSDADHLECYGSAENLQKAYIQFASAADIAISLYGDVDVNGVTFGADKKADFNAKNVRCNGGMYSFLLREGNAVLGDINLKAYGKHNILNALASAAAARQAGISFADIKTGLEAFSGVERRFENIGKINGARCIADYAHHPDEIRAILLTAKKIAKGKLFVVFQPHTYSRTENLFSSFVKTLSPLNNLLIYKTFAAREYFNDKGSALTLSQSVKNSRYGDCPADIADFLKFVSVNDVVMFLGAGDIYDIAKQTVKCFNG